MVTVSIRVEVCNLGSDTYARYLGYTLDTVMQLPRFWQAGNTQIIATQAISPCYSGMDRYGFHLDLSAGKHYIQVCTSQDKSISGANHVVIYINDVKTAEGEVWAYNTGGSPSSQVLQANFEVKEVATSPSGGGTTSGGTQLPEEEQTPAESTSPTTATDTFDVSQITKQITDAIKPMMQIMITIMMVSAVMSMMSGMMKTEERPAERSERRIYY
jgi:hypothetical protein